MCAKVVFFNDGGLYSWSFFCVRDFSGLAFGKLR